MQKFYEYGSGAEKSISATSRTLQLNGSGTRLFGLVDSIWPFQSGRFGHGTFQSRDISVRLWNLAEQRWSDSGFLLSDPILFLKNDIRIRSKSCIGSNHTTRIWKLSGSVLRCTTHIFVLCLFCLMRQNNCWSYFAFS